MKTHICVAVALVVTAVMANPTRGGERAQSFHAQKGGKLQLNAEAGDVVVKGWDKDEVFIRVSSLDEERLKHVSFSQSGGKVVVGLDRAGDGDDIRFEVQVPSVFNVDLRTGGGDITLESPLSGDLRGSTGGGEIHLGNLGGSVRMETAGGDITARDIAGDLSFTTAGGDISIKSIGGAGEVSTAGGSVTVELASRSLHVSSAGGDIKIGKVNQDASLSTAGGNIEVASSQGTITLGTAGGSISMGNGRGKIIANTSAGNVHLEKIEGSVNVRTAAGDVNVTLDPAVGESSSMSTAAGNIVLRIAGNAQATITARNRGPSFGFDDEDVDYIRSDFPLVRPEKRKNAGEAEVILGGGGHKIRLETSMGIIEIRKAK
jgi:DUF4097 and DUF4098 domain-containing protein YvlB